MKLFRDACLILSILCLQGCGLINEDMSDCLSGAEITLLFTRMVSGTDVFHSCVQTVDVMVFDENGLFVTQKTVTQADMDQFRTARPDGKGGTRFFLSPGVYRIVCWGNAGANTVYQNLSETYSFDDAILQHVHCNSGTGVSYDPLYYAPRMENLASPEVFTITVPESGSKTEIINFTAAHDTVELFVKGFKNSFGPATDKPEVEITSMSWGYDFQMFTQNDRPFSFLQNAQDVSAGNGLVAGVQFLTAQIENDNSILINIKEPFTHETIYTVNLKKFLADNKITLDPTDHDLIRIMAEFIGPDVKVTVPKWNSSDVIPEF